jgi:hypothetical protein
MRTYSVSLVLKGVSPGIDVFYKYRDEHLPEEGDIVGARALPPRARGRARVTGVDANSDQQIAATQIG